MILGLLLVLTACGGGDAEEPVPAETSGTGAMPLPTSATSDSVMADPVAVPAADATPVTPPAETTMPDPVPEPVVEPEPTPVPEATPQATGGDYMLQLGSYRSPRNADAQVQRLVDLGYGVAIETAVIDGLTWHRVMLRGLPDRSEAERVGESIRVRLGSEYLIRRSQ